MATALDENYLRENGLSDAAGIVLTPSTSMKKNETEDVPDYNEAFPQLASAGQFDVNRSNAFFPQSSALPYASSLNGNSMTGNTLPNTTTSMYAATKNDEDRRRKLAMLAATTATKIIEIPPNERVPENSRRSGQSSRNNGANNALNTNMASGQSLQKLFTRIQKETSTTVTFFYKEQTLIVSINGRPENVRAAQVQILRELQAPVKSSVNIPLEFHRFIIGARGATLQRLEQETLTRIAVPAQESHSNAIIISGAKDNVKLCEQKILDLYHAQLNKGFERLSIPFLYHPWIRNQLVDELRQQLNVTVDVPPPIKQTDEISIRGEREPVEQAKARILQFYNNLNGKIMTFPLDIPCVQHRFILGKKGAGLKEIFDKTNVVVRIPNQEDDSSTIQVIGETAKIGEAITMIYKMATALTVVQINASRWMHSVVRGERSMHLENLKKTCPDVRIFFRDDHIDLEGPPEEVERARSQIQTVIDELRNSNTTYAEVEIDPQYYKQLIGKNQIKLLEIQDQSGCDIKFPYDDNRLVKLMGTRESVEKARQILLERVQKLANERTTDVSIDPQFYPQIIGAKGKKLDEVRSKFHNIQITFPDVNGKSDKVKLHGDKDDVEKCSRFLQQKVKDMYSVEIDIPRRLHPMLIGKGGANIQRIREQTSDVRIDIPPIDDTSESTHVRISGKKPDVDKARKLIDEYVAQLNVSMENFVEESISIDPKWHVRFFIRNRELLNELQQNGLILIKFPERNTGSDQVILRGPKETIEQVRKRLEDLVDLWENIVTKEMIVPHRHHRYLLAKGGSYIQPIQKEFNVQIKFPPRGNNNNNNNKAEQQQPQPDEQVSNPPAEESSSNDETTTKQDRVRFSGRPDDIEKAMAALEKMIPVESTVEIPYELHGLLHGKAGANIQSLITQYPDVQILFPNVNLAQNTVFLKGQREQVECVRTELLERYEKLEADRQARSYELRFTIKPEFRYLLLGTRGRTIKNLKEKFDVNIQVANTQPPPSAVVPAASSSDEPVKPIDDDQQATPQDNVPLTAEAPATAPVPDLEITLTGYEDKALACRDEILQMIKNFESKITMEIEIDHRIHARIIGSGGQKLQALVKEYDVEIKFPANNQSDKVHVIGNDQEKIDACIDRLLILEEDFLQDLPYRQQQSSNVQTQGEMKFGQQLTNPQQEVPSSHAPTISKPSRDNNNKAKQRQAPFKVKNAPWAATQANGIDGEIDEQQKINGQGRPFKNGAGSSPKKSTGKHVPVPNTDDLAEFPSFSNGLLMTTDDATSQVQSTTVNAVPISWGPRKRNK